jgi:multidrug resistance efflux pump
MYRFQNYKSIQTLDQRKTPNRLSRILIFSAILLIGILLLPWTQTISSDGQVTAYNPANRPQTINAIIGGRIEKWYVQEGQYVEKGDTLVYISEIKPEYMDTLLISRSESQIKSKESSATSYMEKVQALDNQIDAMIDNRTVKLQQSRNKIKQGRYKVTTDSMDLVATATKLDIARKQYTRTEGLYEKNLKSKTDLENSSVKVQQLEAEFISYENKLKASKNELDNLISELEAIDADYRDKISKSESDKAAALSGLYDTEAEVTKMQNEVSNYSIRSGYYYITAPQNGFISKALLSGIGEIIKEGSPLMNIVPSQSDMAVEMFIDPVDLPLIHVGNKIRLQFDGWPAIVFSGWPKLSYGMYTGIVSAVDNYISENGKYRLLIEPDPSDHKWPSGLRMGVAAKGIALLNDVPLWYELWRKINGFPPNYYENTAEKTKDKSVISKAKK